MFVFLILGCTSSPHDQLKGRNTSGPQLPEMQAPSQPSLPASSPSSSESQYRVQSNLVLLWASKFWYSYSNTEIPHSWLVESLKYDTICCWPQVTSFKQFLAGTPIYHLWPLSLPLSIPLPRMQPQSQECIRKGKRWICVPRCMNYVARGRWFHLPDSQFLHYGIMYVTSGLLNTFNQMKSICVPGITRSWWSTWQSYLLCILI